MKDQIIPASTDGAIQDILEGIERIRSGEFSEHDPELVIYRLRNLASAIEIRTKMIDQSVQGV